MEQNVLFYVVLCKKKIIIRIIHFGEFYGFPPWGPCMKKKKRLILRYYMQRGTARKNEKKKKKKKTPGFWGVTVWYQSVGIRIPRARWGMGLEHVVDE